jgi:hypothetical protein
MSAKNNNKKQKSRNKFETIIVENECKRDLWKIYNNL